MESVFTDRKIVETGCMLYMRVVSNNDGLIVYAFKHDEFRCDFQIFEGTTTPGALEKWLLLPVSTDVSY
jgi:hypothetical protein